MCCRFLLIALVLLVFIGTPPADASVASSPTAFATQPLDLLVRCAQTYLDAASYTFSLHPAADGLITAHKRGAKLRIILCITKIGQRYHRAGCSSVRKSQIPISRKEAEARGFAPCGNCRP